MEIPKAATPNMNLKGVKTAKIFLTNLELLSDISSILLLFADNNLSYFLKCANVF